MSGGAAVAVGAAVLDTQDNMGGVAVAKAAAAAAAHSCFA